LKNLNKLLAIFFISAVFSQDIYKPNNLDGRLVTLAPRLDWEAPLLYENNEWLLSWTGTVNTETGIGNTGGFPSSYFQRYDSSMLSLHHGKYLEMLSFVPKAEAVFQPFVFEVGPGDSPDLINYTNLILTGPALGSANYTLNEWGYVNLYNHVSSNGIGGSDFSGDTIPSTYQIQDGPNELWFGFRISDYIDGTFPMGIDNGPPFDYYGNMTKLCWDNFGSWDPADFDTCNTLSLMENNPPLPFNWAIGLYVSDQNMVTNNFNTFSLVQYSQTFERNSLIHESMDFGSVCGRNETGSQNNPEQSRTFSTQNYYNIYENGQLISEIETSFWRMDYELEEADLGQREFGSYEYYVTAVYDTFESEPTNTVLIDISNSPPSDFSLLAPPDSGELSISAADVLNQLNFVWSPCNDADGHQIIYNLELCLNSETGPSCVDTLLSSNSFQIQYNEFIVLMSIENGVSDIFWSVSATDEIDTVGASNGGFTFQLVCEFLGLTDEKIPSEFSISSPYPNPFNPITNIDYNLPEDSVVDLTIFDVMGRRVKTLIKNHRAAGYSSIQWDATNDLGESVSAGLYFYTIEAGNFRQTKKMLLMK